MANPIRETLQSAVKNWWLSLIVGVLFTLMGFWMICSPVSSYVAMVIFFSAFMFCSGVFEIAFAAFNSKMRGWGWYLVTGLVDLLLGAYLVMNPGLTAIVIPFVMAFWLMFRGFSATGFAIDARHFGMRGWGWYLLLGVLAVICALLIIWHPATGAAIAVYMLALAFLFIGLFRILFSLGLRNINKRLKEK